jgi:tetratricopeptide (TPR) repeat protein
VDRDGTLLHPGLAARRPMFRDVLADKLETMSRVLQALDNEPQALEAATEAAAIYTDLTDKQPGRYSGAHARTLLQQAALLRHMGRHGEALAALQPAVQIYRRLAVGDRGTYLPGLAAALARQAFELYDLDRVTEARAAAAEADMIRTDMLLPAQA